ncbi:MAG: AAA family ATPase, partial [Anaerolineales bacterium]|nr:AAA family ATPase [Anaerolineales bacterium]
QILPTTPQTTVSSAGESQAIRESYLQAATFVGRDGEMLLLTTAMNQAKAGQGAAWLLGGESGVGKSRLLRELQTRALVAGFIVLRGQSVADNSGLPYQMWREPLRHLLLTANGVDDATASTLLPLVPDIAQLLGRSVAPAPRLEEQATQQRLFAAVVRLFGQQKRPLLLLAEDLHWANESLAIFPHLTSHIASQPLLIIGTYRSDERPNLPQLLPNMQTLPLRRLPAAAVATLSQSMLGEVGKRPDLLALLQKETEGNAFFLVELVRALAEEAGQLDAVGQMTLPPTLLPDGIQTIVWRRLSRIPQTGHWLLQLTAVAGRELDLNVVRLLNHDQPFDSWLAACAEAMVLEVQNGRWIFSHDKIREGILAAMSSSVRQTSHERVAHALETLYANRRDYAAQLAYHWQQASNPAKERTYAAIAGALATEQYRNQEALAFLERVYALTPDQALAERVQCLLTQEKIYYFLGDRAIQDTKLTEMLALAEQLGDANLLAEVLFRRSIYSFATGNIPQALNSTHLALEQAQIANNISVQGLAN